MTFLQYLLEKNYWMTIDDKKISLTLPPSKDLSLVNVNVAKFDNLYSKNKDFYITSGGGGESIGNRYKNFGEFIAKSSTMQVPQVEVTNFGEINFGNGRHRYAWLRDNGVDIIPIAMTQKSIENARQLGILI